MGCFSIFSIEHLLIWLVVIFTVFAIIRVILSFAFTPPAEFAWILNAAIQIVKIILWAVVVIAVIVIIFSLLACVIPIR